MTLSEMFVVVGGLVLGYWLVNVFLPHLFHKRSSTGAEQDSDESDGVADGVESESGRTRSEGRGSQAGMGPVGDLKWFEILEVAENASREQIVVAYKSQISQYHPDKVARMGPDIRRLAEARSKAINAAYDQVSRR